MSEPPASTVNPPFILAILAALLAAAITDGSSIAIGTKSSLPFITKLVAIPIGIDMTPIAFSTILFASSNASGFSIASMSSDMPVAFFT
jgi:hypothetical protein